MKRIPWIRNIFLLMRWASRKIEPKNPTKAVLANSNCVSICIAHIASVLLSKIQSSRYLHSGYVTAAEAAKAMAVAVATTTAADCRSNRWSMQSLSSALPSLNSITCSSIRFSSSSHCRPSLSLSRTQQPPNLFSSYTGLAANNPLLSLGFSGNLPTFIRFNKF